MTSGFKINHICEEILIIIDKFIPMVVTFNHQFTALQYVHILAGKYELFMS